MTFIKIQTVETATKLSETLKLITTQDVKRRYKLPSKYKMKH